MNFYKTFPSAYILFLFCFTFVACGSEKENNENEEVIKLNTGTDYAIQLVKSIKNNKLVIDKTTANDINAIFGIKISEYQMDSTVLFEGYRLERKFNLNEGNVSSITYSTFSNNYEEENQEVTKDMKMITQELINILGDPLEKSEMNTLWVINNTSISLSTFDSGFDLNIDKYSKPDEISNDEYGETCVGDFYNLKKDLSELFMDNILSGKIKLGKTTKSEMIKIIGDENFSKDYEGLNLAGIFLYDGNVLSSISLDYIYLCEGALSLLDADVIEITSEITNALGVTGNPNSDSTITSWEIQNQTITQTNFSDGYTISISK